jgi:hypothetical protein
VPTKEPTLVSRAESPVLLKEVLKQIKVRPFLIKEVLKQIRLDPFQSKRPSADQDETLSIQRGPQQIKVRPFPIKEAISRSR